MNPDDGNRNDIHSESPIVPSTDEFENYQHLAYDQVIQGSEEEWKLYRGDLQLSVTVEKTLTLTDANTDILVHV